MFDTQNFDKNMQPRTVITLKSSVVRAIQANPLKHIFNIRILRIEYPGVKLREAREIVGAIQRGDIETLSEGMLGETAVHLIPPGFREED
jgi:hypothetical protein